MYSSKERKKKAAIRVKPDFDHGTFCDGKIFCEKGYSAQRCDGESNLDAICVEDDDDDEVNEVDADDLATKNANAKEGKTKDETPNSTDYYTLVYNDTYNGEPIENVKSIIDKGSHYTCKIGEGSSNIYVNKRSLDGFYKGGKKRIRKTNKQKKKRRQSKKRRNRRRSKC
jgi:hypothetical protein